MPTESIYFTKAEYSKLWDEAYKTGKSIPEIVRECVNDRFFPKPPAGASP